MVLQINSCKPDSEFIQWLGTSEAVIAAGSDDIADRLTISKYFETTAVGSLLVARDQCAGRKIFREKCNVCY